jgi:hypothetical protein
MLQKIKIFDAEKNHLPLKAAGAFIGALVGGALVLAALSMLEEGDEFEFEAETIEED